jgi:hypothetical protein
MKFLILFLATFIVLPSTVNAQASLEGTRASLQKQNSRADREGLVRIKDDVALDEMKKNGALVRLPETAMVDPR